MHCDALDLDWTWTNESRDSWGSRSFRLRQALGRIQGAQQSSLSKYLMRITRSNGAFGQHGFELCRLRVAAPEASSIQATTANKVDCIAESDGQSSARSS